MVQVPVLPLATCLGDWTHGVYCDEFAEFQLKDIPFARPLRTFFRPTALERAFFFDPDCPVGRLRDQPADCSQAGTAKSGSARKRGPVATREFLPAPAAGGHPATKPMGSRHRARSVGAARLARAEAAMVLVLAPSQRPAVRVLGLRSSCGLPLAAQMING